MVGWLRLVWQLGRSTGFSNLHYMWKDPWRSISIAKCMHAYHSLAATQQNVCMKWSRFSERGMYDHVIVCIMDVTRVESWRGYLSYHMCTVLYCQLVFPPPLTLSVHKTLVGLQVWRLNLHNNKQNIAFLSLALLLTKCIVVLYGSNQYIQTIKFVHFNLWTMYNA